LNAKGSRFASRPRIITSPARWSPRRTAARPTGRAAYSPDTGLLYVPTAETYAIVLPDRNRSRGAMGLGGKDESTSGRWGPFISAIDYKTGKTVWKHKFRSTGGNRSAPGLMTTAGKLLFGGDVSGNFVAFDRANGNRSGTHRSVR